MWQPKDKLSLAKGIFSGNATVFHCMVPGSAISLVGNFWHWQLAVHAMAALTVHIITAGRGWHVTCMGGHAMAAGRGKHVTCMGGHDMKAGRGKHVTCMGRHAMAAGRGKHVTCMGGHAMAAGSMEPL